MDLGVKETRAFLTNKEAEKLTEVLTDGKVEYTCLLLLITHVLNDGKMEYTYLLDFDQC